MSKQHHHELRMDGSDLPRRAVLTTEGTAGTEKLKAETRVPSISSAVLSVIKALNYRTKLRMRTANTAYTLGYDPLHFSPWNERDTICI
jgi:hypothetical protein